MTASNRWGAVGFTMVALLCLPLLAPAEGQIDARDVPLVRQPQQRFDSGQDIQPIYEGWERNDDGTITPKQLRVAFPTNPLDGTLFEGS